MRTVQNKGWKIPDDERNAVGLERLKFEFLLQIIADIECVRFVLA